MNKLYNVYCDESCHLENDGINDMVLGAVWCPQDKLSIINQDIKEIKLQYGVQPHSELKWTKVAPVKSDLYKEIINGAYSKAMTMEHYKNENIKLRQKIKELKKLLAQK